MKTESDGCMKVRVGGISVNRKWKGECSGKVREWEEVGNKKEEDVSAMTMKEEGRGNSMLE